MLIFIKNCHFMIYWLLLWCFRNIWNPVEIEVNMNQSSHFIFCAFKFINFFSLQDSQSVVEKYKSGFTIPEDIPFEDLSLSAPPDNQGNHASPKPVQIATVKSGTISNKGKKRGGLFGIFSSSKVSKLFLQNSEWHTSEVKRKTYICLLTTLH